MMSTNCWNLHKIIEDDETSCSIIFGSLIEVIIEYFVDEIIHTIKELFG